MTHFGYIYNKLACFLTQGFNLKLKLKQKEAGKTARASTSAKISMAE
jgi:hypothetical protein